MRDLRFAGLPVCQVRGKRGAVAAALIALSALAVPYVAAAQTLDEQYRFFLETDCSRLEFARDAENRVLASEAGPNLAAFCAGPPPQTGPVAPPVLSDPGPGVTTSTSAMGGAAGAAAGRSSLGLDDAALRDRREQGRGEDDVGSAEAQTAAVELFTAGRSAAFVSLDRRFERQRVSDLESGRRSYSLAATIGADYRFGASAVIGLLLSRTELSGDFSDGGGFGHDGHGVSLYGSWLIGDRAFVDVSTGVDAMDRRIERRVGLITVTEQPDKTIIVSEPPVESVHGATRSREKSAEVSGGLDFVIGSVTLGPRFGFAKRRVGIGGHVENGSTPMALAFDGQTVVSERSSIGLQLSTVFRLETRVLVAQLNLDGLHEHEDDQRTITARFAEDLRPNAPRLSFVNRAPDRDWLHWRLSFVGVMSSRSSAFLSIEGTSGHDYLAQYGISAGLRRAF